MRLWEGQLSRARLTHGGCVMGASASCLRDTPNLTHIYTTTEKHPVPAECAYLGVREEKKPPKQGRGSLGQKQKSLRAHGGGSRAGG